MTLDPTPAEEWRAVIGHEGWYEISSLGRVRNIRRMAGRTYGRILTAKVYADGYRAVGLSRDGVLKWPKVHALVAAAFIGPRPEGYEINHRDGNKANNTPANLEYLTKVAHTRHSVETGLLPSGDDHWTRRTPERVRRGEGHGNARLTEAQVREIRALRGLKPHDEIAYMYGISDRMVCEIQLGHAWKHVPLDAPIIVLPKGRLDDDTIRAIRSARGRVTQVELAARYGITQVLVSQIQLRKIYQLVPDSP